MHLNVDKNLLKFLSGIKELAICYGCKDLTNGLQLIKYCNSDFTGNRKSFRSTYSYVFKFTEGPINWKSKRASIVALSILEAETDTFTEGIREISWIIGLFKKLKRLISRFIVLYNDNQNVIITAHNLVLYSRTKHILLKYHYIRK